MVLTHSVIQLDSSEASLNAGVQLALSNIAEREYNSDFYLQIYFALSEWSGAQKLTDISNFRESGS